MNALTLLAQTYSTNQIETYSSNSADAAATAVAFGSFFVFFLIFFAIMYAVFAIFLSLIFKKAGVPQWIAWVPFYNNWKLFEIGNQHGALSLLLYLPVVNIVGAVFQYIAMYHVGRKLGKPAEFVLLAVFLPIVWLIWLGVDKSTWHKEPVEAK